MKRLVPIVTVLGLAALLSPSAFAQTTTNLLVNPGAETGDLTGWTSSGNFDIHADNGNFDSTITPNTGLFDFVGGSQISGSSTVATLTQNVALVGNQGITIAQIDAGSLLANVSFAEQGLNQSDPSDNANVVLTYLSATNVSLGTSVTPIIDSHDGTWQVFNGNYAVPVGTRTIAYTVNFNRNVGSDNDAFVDDTKLTISTGTVSAAAPEPTSAALAGFGVFPAILGLVRRKRFTAAS